MAKMEKLENFVLKSISYNIILQISFRILSFILNAILFRSVSTELIGACNFRLALLYSTIMFLSREPFRRALPTMADADTKWTKFVNSMWLVVPSGIFFSLIIGFLWSVVLEKPDSNVVFNYEYSVYLCCLACVIELCGEPANSFTQMLYLAKLKVLIEASNLLIFNITFVFLAIYYPNFGALSYAVARIINSVIYVSTNYYFLLKNRDKNKNISLFKLMPFYNRNFTIDSDYLKLVRAYYAQSIFKQLLTEGERYMITVFNLLTFSESGVYDIINNLGSLIARFIFLPIEDASYVYFTNSLKRGIKYKDQSQENASVSTSKNYLELVMKMVSLIGILVLVFGQSYSQLLLQIYGGDRLGKNIQCVRMLEFHCIYIFVLSVNGITECFFNATMSESQIQKHNYRMVLFSISFLFFAFVLVKIFHMYGLVIANSLNMASRIYFSCKYINDYFKGYKYNDKEYDEKNLYKIQDGFLPNLALFTVLSASFGITKFSESLFENSFIIHFGIGAVSFLLTLGFILKQEKQIMAYFLKLLRRN